MEKSISIRVYELKKTIADAVSDSMLPPCVVSDILELFLMQACEQVEKQLQIERNKILYGNRKTEP